MDNLEKKHMATVEEAIEILRTSGYNHISLISSMNQLIGYLIATDELKNEKR